MIRNTLLPEKVGAYYLFAKRILGFDLNRTHVTATRVLLKGTNVTIEQCIEEKIEIGGTDHQERVAQAIKNCIAQMPKYHEIRAAIDSSLVVFKELKLPFTSHEKINMAVEFEVGPLLPFAINDAVIDFIITKVNAAEGNAEILVAAVQKQHLAYQLQCFEMAGVTADCITVDMFALYSLYRHIAKNVDENVIFVDMGAQSTTICYIKQGQLHFIRSLPKGINTIAKSISKELNMQLGQAIGNIFRFGMKSADDPKYTAVMTQTLKQFWDDIQFTVQAISDADQMEKEKVLLLGTASDIEGLASFLKDELATDCIIFDAHSLLQDSAIRVNTKHPIKPTEIMSVAIAIPFAETEFFNLRQKEFKLSDTMLLLRQMIIAALLLIAMFGSLISFMIIQVHSLKVEAQSLEQDTVAEIKERFPKIDETEEELETVLESAQKEIEKREAVLSAFLRSPSSSILNYLLEITTRLNPQALDLKIDQILITEDHIVFKASVRDYEALKVLEHDLAQSPLFKHIPKQEEREFTMHIPLVKGKAHGNS